MKRVELESFFKSFLLFFISQTLLVGALFWINYEKELQTLDEKLFSEMRVCSYTLSCKKFEIDFVPAKEYEPYRLYKKSDELSAYFSIPNSTKNYLKLYLPKEKYQKEVLELKNKNSLVFLITTVIIFVLSIFFSLYTLAPLRNALRLTEEFIKDILHDFNTPLSTLRLNVSMLEHSSKNTSKIERIENSVATILRLQENLKAYLQNHDLQRDECSLDELIQERVKLVNNRQNIDFNIKPTGLKLYCNRDAMIRVLDNLISNAIKYNKEGGSVTIVSEGEILKIKDSGKGIQNPKRVFERFYKEQERGIGIGLHIVKKLCDELGIDISLESEVDKGTIFYLDLAKIVKR